MKKYSEFFIIFIILLFVSSVIFYVINSTINSNIDKIVLSKQRIEKIFEVKEKLSEICIYTDIRFNMGNFEIWYSIDSLTAFDFQDIKEIKKKHEKHNIRYQIILINGGL